MPRRRVFRANIVDSTQVASIYLYLQANWWRRKLITVHIWQDHIRQPTRTITSQNEIEKLHRYLLDDFNGNKIRVIIYEEKTNRT